MTTRMALVDVIKELRERIEKLENKPTINGGH